MSSGCGLGMRCRPLARAFSTGDCSIGQVFRFVVPWNLKITALLFILLWGGKSLFYSPRYVNDRWTWARVQQNSEATCEQEIEENWLYLPGVYQIPPCSSIILNGPLHYLFYQGLQRKEQEWWLFIRSVPCLLVLKCCMHFMWWFSFSQLGKSIYIITYWLC